MKLIFTILLTVLLCLPMDALANWQEMEKDIEDRISTFHKFKGYTGETLVKAASDPTFKAYFQATGADEKEVLKHKIDFLSMNTQAKFNIDEMCLIDKKGQEISRIVFNKIAPDKELSSEEASAPFFDPAFKKNQGEFHISAPYVSADSLRWVICFATPIVLDDGSKPGIYHYEMSMYVFQNMLNKNLSDNSDKFFLVVNEDGYIVSDSREKYALEYNVADTEMETPYSDYFPSLEDKITGFSDKLMNSDASGDYSLEGQKYNYLVRPIGYNNWKGILFYPVD